MIREWGKATSYHASHAMSLTLKARAQLEWNLQQEASRWMGRRLKPKSGTQLVRRDTELSHQRKFAFYWIMELSLYGILLPLTAPICRYRDEVGAVG